MFTIEMLNLMWTGLLETLYMTLISAALSYVLGLPLGLVLVVTDKDGVRPCPALNRALGTVVNALRSVPFLILLFTVLPVTRFLTGTTIGPTATIVPLTIAAAPFVARMVESSVREVDRGVIEASLSMGASTMQIVLRVLLPRSSGRHARHGAHFNPRRAAHPDARRTHCEMLRQANPLRQYRFQTVLLQQTGGTHT